MVGATSGALYSLTSNDDEADFWGYAEDAIGLFTPLGDGRRRVELLGCAPRGGLLRASARVGTKRANAGNADLAFLDASGREIGSYFVNRVTVEESSPSARGAGLVDLTVSLWCDDLLPQADRVWDLVRSGALNRKGLWHDLDAGGRWAWLSVALWHSQRSQNEDDPVGTVHELDGSLITDTTSFYCALGEAVNGPGGYFGWNLAAVNDCLYGRWGTRTPFTLIWNNSALGVAALRSASAGGDDDWFGVLMDVFRDHAVDVQLR
ncbi:barstar family protein [Streptomyces sp. NBC_00448]|uniref:barstar family protein n=1 Tax=Streptomyces sp. NBC_00448 TaxID=2903652 RepID=UPI002E24E9E0